MECEKNAKEASDPSNPFYEDDSYVEEQKEKSQRLKEEAELIRNKSLPGRRHLLQIQTKSGRDISEFSQRPEEQEVILVPHTCLQYVKTKSEGNFIIYVYKEV